MARLYVTEQGAALGLVQGRVRVNLGEQILSSTPFDCVDSISLFGNVGISTPLIHRCIQRNCRVSFFSRAGRYQGSCFSPAGKNVPLRIAQVRTIDDPDFVVRIAATITQTKIRNSRRFLKRQVWNNRDLNLAQPLNALRKLAANCRYCQDPKTLRSLEARAARLYFSALGSLVSAQTEFTARIRRPPKGMLNVLLSLGYSLLTAECSSALEAAGLDPAIGVLHALRHGRSSLSLDLVEEFRTPVVDRLAVSLIVKDYRDFRETGEPATILPKASLDRFFREYEGRMTTPVLEREHRITLRQAVHRQAGRLATCFRTGNPEYTPFFYR